MVTHKFTIFGRLPGLNEMINASRTNKYRASKQKVETEKLIALSALRLKDLKLERITIKVDWFEPNKRRDKDNIRAGIKFILDALQSINAIQNDNWRVVEGIQDTYNVDAKNPRVVVSITEI